MLNRIAFVIVFMIAAIVVLLSMSGCTSSGSDSHAKSGDVALGSANHEGADDDDSSDDDADDDSNDEVEIPLADVPVAVKSAAEAAVPGIVLEEAERETENGETVYCLEGEVDDVEYEVEVNADGEVIEIEKDDADDED